MVDQVQGRLCWPHQVVEAEQENKLQRQSCGQGRGRVDIAVGRDVTVASKISQPMHARSTGIS